MSFSGIGAADRSHAVWGIPKGRNHARSSCNSISADGRTMDRRFQEEKEMKTRQYTKLCA